MAKGTYSAGTAFLTVVPSFLGVEKAFREQVRQLAAAADKDIAAGVARGLQEANRQAKDRGTKGGRDYGGAYAAEARKAIDAAWRALPEPQPGVNLRKWDKALATIRGELRDLSSQRIGIDIDRETFDRAIDDFRRRLEDLRDTAGGRNKEIQFFNADSAAKQLAEFQRFADQLSRRSGDAGELAGSAFNERMARVLRDGIAKIPPMRITADPAEAERRLAELRDRMQDLADKRIGVDIDAGAAYAELRSIQAELGRLDRRSVRVDIRTNAHEASAGIGQFITQAEQAGQSVQNIGTRANFSLSRLEYLIALGASLGTAIVPAAAAAAAAIGLIGTGAISAVTGLGVVALGVSGVGEAVKALNQYSNDQEKSAASVDQANRRVASSTDQVRMAQLSLANTRRQVAEAAEDASRRVAEAERGVADARRQAARDSANAAREVADARRTVADAEDAVGDARRQAAIDIAEANRQVRDAQRGVVDAEREALDVRKSLNEAIEDAKLAMSDLSVQLKRNEQDQAKAVTAQMQALEELNKLKTNPRATQIELRQAQDAYNEQTVRLLELKQRHKELAADKSKYDKEGVEGDRRVIAARKRIAEAEENVGQARERLAREQDQREQVQVRSAERISDAQDRVARAQEQVARAQEAQRETELRGQQRIAAAQRQVADARRAQARQALDGQYQLQQASNAVTQAQRSQQQAWQKTGTAGGEALDKLNEKMGVLSPAAQRFARYLFGLKDEVLRLRAAASEPLLPRLEEAIDLLLPYLPAVEKFISKVAAAMGELAIRSVQALGNPVWQRFFRFIDANAVPSLNMMFETGMNLTEGLVSLFLALTPFNKPVGTGLVELSRDFAEWAARLDRSQGYQDFLDYVKENGPRVVQLIGELGELLIDLVREAAPLGSVVLRVLTLLVDVLNSIPDGALAGLVIGIAAVSAGLTGLGAIMRVVKFRQQLTDIFGPRISQMVQTYARDTGRATAETGRFGTATATVSGIAAAARDRVQGYGSALGAIPARLQAATTGHSVLGRSMDALRVSALSAATAVNGPGGIAAAAQSAAGRVAALGPRMVAGLSSAVAFFGGPWGLALAGAAAAVTYLTAKSIDQKQKVDTLKTALGQLSDKYKELASSGRAAGQEADEAFRAIVRNNPEMQQAVVTLSRLGITFDEMVRAASSGDPAAVVKKINAEIERLNRLIEEAQNAPDELGLDIGALQNQAKTLTVVRDAFLANASAMGVATEAQNVMTASSQRHVAMERIVQNNVGASSAQLATLANRWDTNQARLNELNATLGNFGDDSAAATRRADDLTRAIQRQYGASIQANDAAQRWNSSILTLRESVAANGRTLDINTRAGLSNRDALIAAAKSSRDMFIEEVRLGGKLPEVTKKHNDRINKLRDEATKLGLTRTETNKLIKVYGDIDPAITTKYSTQNFNQVFEQAKKLQFAQIMLELGITDPKEAEARWKRQNAIISGNYPTGSGGTSRKATGGQIAGPGTSTSDEVLIWASDGEHMLTAAEVRAAGGHEAIYAWRRTLMHNRRLPAMEELPKQATGGPVIKPLKERDVPVMPSGLDLPRFAKGGAIAPFIVELGGTKLPTMKQALAKVQGQMGTAAGGRGWRWQMKVLRAQFPGLPLYSGYRPGAITTSGNRSWHGIDGGRAVDVPPRQTVFNFIHDKYGKNTKELIWGGDPNRNIQRGRHHRYSDSLLRAHGPYKGRPGPSPHVHWAFDQGGMLPPGYSTVYNGTGAPEPVLTSQQWRDLSALAQAAKDAAGRGNTYNFAYRDTTLDAAELRRIQDREAVLARDGRAR